MATGDICGNVERLHRELRQVRYQEDVNEVGLRMGDPVYFLPILHHVLLKYSRYVAMEISSKGYVLRGKTDQRFVECSFKVFREVLHLKPALTPSQFLAQGYAERKVLLLHDVVRACKAKHDELSRSQKAAKPKKKNLTRGPQNTAKPQSKRESIEAVSPSEVLRAIRQKQANKQATLEASRRDRVHAASKSAGSSNQDATLSSTDSCGPESPSQSNPEMEGSPAVHSRHARGGDPTAHRDALVRHHAADAMGHSAFATATPPAVAYMDHVMSHGAGLDAKQSMSDPGMHLEVTSSGQAFSVSDCLVYDDAWASDGHVHTVGTAPCSTTRAERGDSFKRFPDTGSVGAVIGYGDEQDDDDDVPVARDWSQVRVVCESQRFPSRHPASFPLPPGGHHSQTFYPPEVPMDGSFPAACSQQQEDMSGAGLEPESDLMQFVREMAARLSKVESELSDTRQELADTRGELVDAKKEVMETKRELMDAEEEQVELTTEVAHLRDTMNANVTIMEGRIKFLEAMVKSQASQNAMEEHAGANHPMKPQHDNPIMNVQKFSNVHLSKRNSNPDQVSMDGESRHSLAMNSSICAMAANGRMGELEGVEASEGVLDDHPGKQQLSVLDKLQSSFAREKLASSMGSPKCDADEWVCGTPPSPPKANHVWDSCEESGGIDDELSGISDTAQLIAVLSRRNQEAQQFLRSFKMSTH